MILLKEILRCGGKGRQIKGAKAYLFIFWYILTLDK
jgi:hypothetical protein